MRPLKLLVITPPNARHLSLLEKLPDSTTITVGRHPDAFVAAAPEADVILNGMGVGDTLKQIWSSAPKVQWVHSLSAGLESTLFPELIESPVPMTNARGVFKRSLGEFAVSAVLYFAKDLRQAINVPIGIIQAVDDPRIVLDKVKRDCAQIIMSERSFGTL